MNENIATTIIDRNTPNTLQNRLYALILTNVLDEGLLKELKSPREIIGGHRFYSSFKEIRRWSGVVAVVGEEIRIEKASIHDPDKVNWWLIGTETVSFQRWIWNDKRVEIGEFEFSSVFDLMMKVWMQDNRPAGSHKSHQCLNWCDEKFFVGMAGYAIREDFYSHYDATRDWWDYSPCANLLSECVRVVTTTDGRNFALRGRKGVEKDFENWEEDIIRFAVEILPEGSHPIHCHCKECGKTFVEPHIERFDTGTGEAECVVRNPSVAKLQRALGEVDWICRLPQPPWRNQFSKPKFPWEKSSDKELPFIWQAPAGTAVPVGYLSIPGELKIQGPLNVKDENSFTEETRPFFKKEGERWVPVNSFLVVNATSNYFLTSKSGGEKFIPIFS